jgi:3'-phosphoadenosine 5'-phosphosulfate sulfotransferase (PAPS reductase)/FAD synthetase
MSIPMLDVLVSGGKDSFTTAEVVNEAGKLRKVIALETHISTPDWKPFLMKTCEERRWPLEFYATQPNAYEDFVLRYGFPGPSKHSWVMRVLKGRAIREYRRMNPDGVLASGVRADESVKRAASTRPVGQWEGVPILAPIYDWTTEETWAFFNERGFERAPGYSTLQISGDCLCGAYAREGEPEAIKFWYPAMWQRFEALKEAVREKHPTRCDWGCGWKQKAKPKTKDESMVCVECAPRDLFEALPEAA